MIRELDLDEMKMVSGGLWIGLDHIDANVTGTSLVADGIAGYNAGGVDGFLSVVENSLWQFMAASGTVLNNPYSSAPNAYIQNADGSLSINPEWQAAVDSIEIDWVGVAMDLLVIATAGATASNPLLWQARLGTLGLGGAAGADLPATP